MQYQPDKYVTDSDNESDEEGDFEVVYGRTCMTRSGRSVRDHDWCVWIYEAGVILMPVIRLNLICTYSKSRLIGVLIGYRLGTDHLKSYGGGAIFKPQDIFFVIKFLV